jgi:GTP-binding protein EngB required for normal cell division
MGKKKIKIRLGKKGKIEKELDVDNFLPEIRNELLDTVTFPFIFLNEDEEKIQKEDEAQTKLGDILDGKNLYLKKEIIKREMIGQKYETKDGLDYYIYPQKELTNTETNRSSNIMVIGETGVGKSTWLHCFINYLQGIQIEEKNRYYLFDEKKLQDEYEKKYGKKTSGCSVTDRPAIYNIEPTVAFNNPIRLIDTPGFGDVRGEEYDKNITKYINDLFTNQIETLHSIVLIFKATETRAHDRTKKVLDKLFSLFGEEIKKNLVIVFTFVDDFNDITAFRTLTDEKSPFFNILGNIKDLPYFMFNNKAYFTKDIDNFSNIYDNNTMNFGKLLKHVFNLKKISLESSKKVIKNRFEITNNISNVCCELVEVIGKLTSSLKNRNILNNLKKDLEICKKSPYDKKKVIKQRDESYIETYTDYCSSGWYVLYCYHCERVCHRDCRGPNEGLHSNEYGCNAIGIFSCDCSYCGCHYSSHSFHDYIEKTRNAIRKVDYEAWEDDPASIANEEEKAKKRELINKDIEKKENELKELEAYIHDSLNESIDKLYIIADKEKDLNKIALKKYEGKNGFCKKILSETIQEDKIKNIFNTTLDDIESICSSEEKKEQSIIDIQKLLNSSF